MAFLIGGANSAADTGFSVANSCRFNDGDSAYMHKTPGGAGNMKTWTWNAWIKRGTMSATQFIMEGYGGSADETQVYISSGGAFAFYTIGTGMGDNKTISSTNLLRDPSAWYMLTVRVDTTDATANNRCRLYINGTEITYTNHDALTEDGDGAVNEAVIQYLGRRNAGDYFDGYMAEVCLVDGSSLAPTSFGEFNSDSPTIWQPIDVSGLSFGTNGYYLDFEDSSNLGNDANGGTDLTEVNLAAADQATDTSTNSFATMNNLIPGVSNITYSEGNLLVTQTTGAWVKATSTFGISAGKWYWEAKWVGDNSGVGSWLIVGVDNNTTASTTSGYTSTSVGWKKNGNIGVATSLQTDIAAYAEGDVLSVALDMDNDAIYFRKNGASWENSGDPTSGSDKTGAYSLPVANSTYFATISPYDTSIAGMNFGGCPSFAISSSNADADGYGNFEYAVPSGY